MIKKFLKKYGRHFWIISLLFTLLYFYQFIELNGNGFIVLMFGVLTYYFYLKGTGKIKDVDDPFAK